MDFSKGFSLIGASFLEVPLGQILTDRCVQRYPDMGSLATD